jgi:hypothetical protein
VVLGCLTFARAVGAPGFGPADVALAQPGATLDHCCETVTQAVRQRGEDDITLLLARIR